MLEPRYKWAPKAMMMASSARGFPDEDFSALLQAPENRVRVAQSSPLPKQQPPPPHARALTMVSLAGFEISEDPATSPKFFYRTYGIGSEDTVTMHPKLPQDLIISITLKPGTGDQFELREISIVIRIGKTTAKHKNLTTAYRGTRANILSNLRFNVIPANGADNTLVLMPRSTEGWVRVSLLNGMSFVLNGVVLNEYEEDVDVQTSALEKYHRSQDIGSKFDIRLVKETK